MPLLLFIVHHATLSSAGDDRSDMSHRLNVLHTSKPHLMKLDRPGEIFSGVGANVSALVRHLRLCPSHEESAVRRRRRNAIVEKEPHRSDASANEPEAELVFLTSVATLATHLWSPRHEGNGIVSSTDWPG